MSTTLSTCFHGHNSFAHAHGKSLGGGHARLYNIPMQRILAAVVFALWAGMAVAGEGINRTYVYTPPMRANAALNGNMFTNDTELLTPQGIFEAPPEEFFLAQPAAGDMEETSPSLPTAETSPTRP